MNLIEHPPDAAQRMGQCWRCACDCTVQHQLLEALVQRDEEQPPRARAASDLLPAMALEGVDQPSAEAMEVRTLCRPYRSEQPRKLPPHGVRAVVEQWLQVLEQSHKLLHRHGRIVEDERSQSVRGSQPLRLAISR